MFSDAEVRRIITFRAKGRNQPRTWTLLVLMLDTGLRLSEALTLERRHVDLNALAIKVLGKGHRERWVPISIECRKHLHRLLARTEGAHIAAAATSGSSQFSASRLGGYDVRPTGNAVNLEDEMLKVAGNQMDYQAVTTLYQRSLGLIKTASLTPESLLANARQT